MGQYGIAEDRLNEVLALKEEHYGPDSLDVGNLYVNLGEILEQAQKPDKAQVSPTNDRMLHNN